VQAYNIGEEGDYNGGTSMNCATFMITTTTAIINSVM